MNGVDFVVLLVVAFSAMMAFMRGFVREILGLGAWIGAGVTAFVFFPIVQPMMRKTIGNPDLADPIAFGVVFLVLLILLSLIARFMGRAVRAAGLGGLDRTLGLVYGLARGAVLMIGLYIGAGLIEPVESWPNMVLEARTLPSIYLGAVWVAGHVPDVYKPVLAVPPAARNTNAADLLHATPIGRAQAAPLKRP
jgi:membrane protein required for colicin V production